MAVAFHLVNVKICLISGATFLCFGVMLFQPYRDISEMKLGTIFMQTMYPMGLFSDRALPPAYCLTFFRDVGELSSAKIVFSP